MRNKIKKTILVIFYPLIMLINLLHFLTILPLPKVPYHSLNKTVIFLPFAGMLIGLMVAFFYQLGYWLNFPPFVCGAMALIAQVILTGGLHEDGLADSADALGVRAQNSQEKLQIIRDSHAIGTYGALALILVILGKAMLFTAVIHPKILWLILPLAHMLSRAQWVVLIYMLPIIEGSQLAKMIANISKWQLITTLLLSFALSFALVKYFLFFDIQWELILLFWLVQIYALYFFIAKKFGGFSGDLLGASQQITEILIIFASLCIIFLAK